MVVPLLARHPAPSRCDYHGERSRTATCSKYFFHRAPITLRFKAASSMLSTHVTRYLMKQTLRALFLTSGLTVTVAAQADDTAAAATRDEGTFRSDCQYPYAATSTRRLGERVLTVGSDRWNLFDTRTRRIITSGPIPSNTSYGALAAKMEGALAMVPASSPERSKERFQLMRASDGQPIGTVSAAGYSQLFALSGDGSYVWRVATTSISAWSPDTRTLFDLPPDRVMPGVNPLSVVLVAVPNYLRYLYAGQLFSIDIRDGKPQSAPLLPVTLGPVLEAWFADRKHFVRLFESEMQFFTEDGKLLRASKRPPQFDFIREAGSAEPTIGTGRFFWGIVDKKLTVYQLDISSSSDAPPIPVHAVELPPSATPYNTVARDDGALLALFPKDELTMEMLDLHGSEVVQHTFKLPARIDTRSFSGDGDGRWSLATTTGVIYARDDDDAGTYHALGCRKP